MNGNAQTRVGLDNPSPRPSPRSFFAGRGRENPGGLEPRAALADSLALGYNQVIPTGFQSGLLLSGAGGGADLGLKN